MPRGVRAGLAVLVLAALAPLPAFGQDVGVTGPVPLATVPSGERSRLADELETITAHEADVLRRVEAARRKVDEQTLIAAKLDNEISALSGRLASARRALAAAEARTARADRAVVAAQQRVDEARRLVQKHALAAYVGHGQLPALTASFTDRSDEAGIAVRYAQVANGVRQRELRSYRDQRKDLVDLEDEAAAARDDAKRQEADLSVQADELARQHHEQDVARVMATQAFNDEQAMATEVQVTKVQVTKRLNQLKAESAALGDLIRQRGSSSAGGRAATSAAKPLAVKTPATTAKPPASTGGPPVVQAPAATSSSAPKAKATSSTPAPTTAKVAASTTAKVASSTSAKPAATTGVAPTVAKAAETTAKPTTTTKAAATTAVKATTTTAVAKADTTVKTSASAVAKSTTSVVADPEGAVVTGKAPGPYSTNAPPIDATLQYPLPGAPIVGRYGMRTQPVLGVYRMHEGIDIWAPAGTPIHAAGSGKVIWAGDRGGYGIAVIIDHGRGLSTVYAHNSSVAVSVGQVVSQGDTISYVGQTGLAGGPHLHLEVRIDGVAYDPLRFVHPG
jgi:murein DD-endopeptidase MepM/ murein hydrolase activator NlpD